MSFEKKLCRTMLFCPAINPKLYINAPFLGADCIIFDLEDSIRYNDKDAARELFSEALKSMDFGDVQICGRINALTTEFGEKDVRLLVPSGMRYMRLPTSESKEQIQELDRLLTELEEEHGIEKGSCKIQCSIESPLGVHNMEEIVTASDRVVSMSFGAEDYTRLLGVDRTKDATELFYARTKMVSIAKVVGIEAIDTSWTAFDDLEGFEKETKLGRQLGFSGKSCIHPSQIEVVHKIFTPTMEEIEKSLAVLKAVEEAGIEQGGVIQINGKMIDIPVIEKAKRIISLAKSAKVIS
ncbi:MAG: HpcH/HpaI aldolase/citrate lyase family protein [Lachnospirales bacterium]